MYLDYYEDYDTCSFDDKADGPDWVYYPSETRICEDDVIDYGNLGFYSPWVLCAPYRANDDNDYFFGGDFDETYIHLNRIKEENW